MNYDFDIEVDRWNLGNLKEYWTPDAFRQKNIITFAAGEMDFKTAPCLTNKIIDVAQKGIYGYTICTDDFLSSIQWWMKNQRNAEIEKNWVLPTLGTIHSLATAIRLFTTKEDAIIVQPPTYSRYEQAATRLHRKTVYNYLIEENGTYYMDFEDLERKMADKHNKIFVLSNPQNPIGRVWNEEELKKIAQLSLQYGVYVFSDEIFSEMTFDSYDVVPYWTIEDRYSITSTAIGKAFNCTGFNQANLIIPNEDLYEQFMKQRDADHFGSIGTFEYAAIMGAYTKEGMDWIAEAKKYIKWNIDYIVDYFAQNFPEDYIFETQGTFTIWIKWNSIGLEGDHLHSWLRQEAMLDLENGLECSDRCGSYSRMNVASTHQQIIDAMERLKNAMSQKIRRVSNANI